MKGIEDNFNINEEVHSVDADRNSSEEEKQGRLRRLMDFLFTKKIENLKNINRLKNDGNLFTTLIDRFIHQRRCPYCFSYVSRRIYREKSHPSGGVRVNNISLSLPNIKTHECPHCSSSLPPDFFQSRSSSIAVVGGREAGKSSFITVFCDLLLNQKTIFDELGLFGTIINAEGKELFERNRRTLINQEIALPGTTDTQDPIVVRLQSKHHSKVMYINLLDSPGEDFDDPNTLIERYPNLQLADGIIFLMNPLDIAGITELIEMEHPGTTPTQRHRINNFNIIQHLYQLYTHTRRIKPNRSIKIPTVFCLSRADILEDISNLYMPNDLDPNLVVKEDIIEEMILVSEDLKDFLEDTDKRLLNLIDKYFKTYQLFPVSALGKKPTEQAERQTINGGIDPKGILQPFLWILMATKFLK